VIYIYDAFSISKNIMLQEVFIGFCSDGASVMLETKSGVGKLLKGEFPDIVLWHCLNHRLDLLLAMH